MSTIDLPEHGATTTLANTVLCASKRRRDGALASGMMRGVEASYDRLDEVRASSPAGGSK